MYRERATGICPASSARGFSSPQVPVRGARPRCSQRCRQRILLSPGTPGRCRAILLDGQCGRGSPASLGMTDLSVTAVSCDEAPASCHAERTAKRLASRTVMVKVSWLAGSSSRRKERRTGMRGWSKMPTLVSADTSSPTATRERGRIDRNRAAAGRRGRGTGEGCAGHQRTNVVRERIHRDGPETENGAAAATPSTEVLFWRKRRDSNPRSQP
jgi:hypothetical protein